MRYLAIAVLLAIMAGAISYHLNHRDHSPPAASGMGWMQR